MSVHDIYSKAYADQYIGSHRGERDADYRMGYWNHFFLNCLQNPDASAQSHLLEEGGGTCGVWKTLNYNYYTSVDVSEEMNRAAQEFFSGDTNKKFISGNIFSPLLQENSFSAIVANAYGVYYRPDYEHLKRFYDLLRPKGLIFVAIDPDKNLKHKLAAPFSGLIDKHIRRYTRVSSKKFEDMALRAGFKVWMSVDYSPAQNWKRQAFFLLKD